MLGNYYGQPPQRPKSDRVRVNFLLDRSMYEAVKEDADTDMESELVAGGNVIFSGIENLDIAPGFEYIRSLRDSDADPVYAVKLVMEYTIF